MSDNGQLHRKSPIFGKVPEELFHDLTITDGAVRLYAHLHWRYGRTQRAFEKQPTIASWLGIGERAVRDRILELESANWVIVIQRRTHGSKTAMSNKYHVFEDRNDAIDFRANPPSLNLDETIREKTSSTPRKARSGVGGKPSHKPKSNGTQMPIDNRNSDTDGEGDINRNSNAVDLEALKAFNQKHSLSPSGDPAPTTSKPKAKAPSRLYRDPSEPSEEVTPEAARIALLPSVNFDDFGGDAWSKPASRTDGLFDAVFEVFGITDAEKRLNSQAGKYVMLLAGTASGTDEWGANALPKDWAFTGNHLVQWSHWYQETVLKNDPNMNMPSKPGVISGSIQGWWAKGRPLSSKDAAMGRTAQQPSKTVVEEVQLTEEERLERLRTINELRARYGGKR